MDKSRVNIREKFQDHPLFNELICGTNFGFMAKRGYYLRPEVLCQPELMKKAGINWATLNMNFCQTHYYSQKVYLDFEFSTGELELSEITKRLHDNGIKVLFKPCLTPLDSSWMGLVNFPNTEQSKQIQGVDSNYWGKWFHSFIEAEKYFADLAERIGMDAMMIGAEYYGTEQQHESWCKVIEEVRGLYSNPISYECTIDSWNNHDLSWFNKLDFLSYSYYPPACPVDEDYFNGKKDINNNPNYSVEDMQKFLKPEQAQIRAISERFNRMPIVFTEFGVRSAHGCIMRPYDFLAPGGYDGDEQANFMEASFRTYYGLPEWMGMFWWKWDETQNRPHYHLDPRGDCGFTVQEKPAEEILKKWVSAMQNHR